MSSSDESEVSAAEGENNDSERSAIRAQLSTLSFEELQKLKEKVGTKVYKEALFGDKAIKKKDESKKVFKRENKNRPREMSSKKPVRLLSGVPKVKRDTVRDPRFDPLCGEFDKKQFSENYNFLSTFRSNDMKQIRAELKETTDPEREKELRRLLQRLNDKQKESKKIQIDKEKKEKQKREIEIDYSEGRIPRFKNKSEMRVESLVKQYEDLKKEGVNRIQRHLKRRQQKVKKRSHRAPTGLE